METITLNAQDLKAQAASLRAGQRVLLSGTIYTARDAAHKRLFAMLDRGEPLPLPIEGASIYFAGATATKPGRIIGSVGPTTSSRMDPYTPRLMDLGLVSTIGKGGRSAQVVDACRRNSGLYLCATGGAGALIASFVTSCREIAFLDLGCEAIKELTVEQLPLVVGIDARGATIFA